MPLDLQKSDSLSLDLTGVTLTRNAMHIADEASYRRAAFALNTIDSCAAWWQGDALLYAELHNLKSFLEQGEKSLHATTIYGHIEVARLFAPADRHPGLSFSHHRAVRYHLGAGADLKEAKRWLVRASVKDWTVGDLREAMRLDDRKDEKDPGPMRGFVSIGDFAKVSRMVESIKIEEIPDYQRGELKKSTEPLFNFLCAIHRKPFDAITL